MVEAVQEGRKIILGRLGEHITRVKKFNIGNLLAQYPDALFTVLNRRPGEESAYAVAASHCEIDGNCLLWTIHSEDVAIEGKGRCELHMQNGEDGIYKSYIWDTEVLEALDGSGEAPEPWQPLVDEIAVAANEARGAAETATTAAGTASSAAETASMAAERAESAASMLENVSASAETLEPGTAATAQYTSGTFLFGIPRGERGLRGEKGDTGDTGIQGPKGDPGEESVMVATQLSGNLYRLGLERM